MYSFKNSTFTKIFFYNQTWIIKFQHVNQRWHNPPTGWHNLLSEPIRAASCIGHLGKQHQQKRAHINNRTISWGQFHRTSLILIATLWIFVATMSVLNRWHWLNGYEVDRGGVMQFLPTGVTEWPAGWSWDPGAWNIATTGAIHFWCLPWHSGMVWRKSSCFLTVCPRILPFLLILLKCDPFIESIYVVNAT